VDLARRSALKSMTACMILRGRLCDVVVGLGSARFAVIGLRISRKGVELGAYVVVRMRMLCGEGGLVTVPLYQVCAGSCNVRL